MVTVSTCHWRGHTPQVVLISLISRELSLVDYLADSWKNTVHKDCLYLICFRLTQCKGLVSKTLFENSQGQLFNTAFTWDSQFWDLVLIGSEGYRGIVNHQNTEGLPNTGLLSKGWKISLEHFRTSVWWLLDYQSSRTKSSMTTQNREYKICILSPRKSLNKPQQQQAVSTTWFSNMLHYVI